MNNAVTSLASISVALLSATAVCAAPFVPERNAQVVAVSPDGSLVATGKSGMSNSEFPPRPHPTIRKCGLIQIWDARSGQMLHRLQSFGDFTQLEFSRDGKRLVSCRLFTPDGELEMSEVHVWDVATGKSVHVFNRCHAFALTPDSKGIVLLSRSKCVLYGMTSFTKQLTYEELGKSISVSVSSDGTRVLGVQERADGYCIVGCDRKTTSLLAVSPTRDDLFYRVAISPTNDILATGHENGTVTLWSIEKLMPLSELTIAKQGRQSPFFAPNGRTLGVANQTNGDVEFWDVSSRRQLTRYTFQRGTFHTYHPRRPQTQLRPEDDPTRFVFMPDGSSFFAGCFGGMIRSVNSGQELKRFGY